VPSITLRATDCVRLADALRASGNVVGGDGGQFQLDIASAADRPTVKLTPKQAKWLHANVSARLTGLSHNPQRDEDLMCYLRRVKQATEGF